MEKFDEELELLRAQNEMLKLKLEHQSEKKGSNGLLIAIIILLCGIIAAGIILYFSRENNNSSNSSYENDNSNVTQEKQCARWENEYNFSYCQYSVGNNNGCKVIGQKCVEWE